MLVSDKLDKAFKLIDAQNQEDPNKIELHGTIFSKEFLYSARMSQRMAIYSDNFGEEELIAARAQHICRWKVPRNSYPMDKKGYYQWRTGLYTFHAEKAAEIMGIVGYDQSSIDKVKKMISKQDIKNDPDCQLLEDVSCLVFIEHYLEEFVNNFDKKEKLPGIVKKTWEKMSPKAQQEALSMNLNPELKSAIKQALA